MVANTRAHCLGQVARLKSAGETLFVGGAIMGSDRIEGRTGKDGYGDERMVAVAIATEVGADLAASAVDLMTTGHTYTAGAALRQIIECEYLLTLFAREVEAAREWLNADDRHLRRFFTPAKMRERTGGTFAAGEYQSHCAIGGHPSPKSRMLLSNHSTALPPAYMWDDLSLHLDRLWASVEAATDALPFGPGLLTKERAGRRDQHTSDPQRPAR